MTSLSSLKLTNTTKPVQVPQVVLRRNKLSKRLWEQIELAKAEQSGATFGVKKFRSYTDKETGIRKQIETNKRLKSWWFVADNGKLSIAVRYGAKVLELAKGKFAVEISNANELVPTLELIKQAVENGELDNAIDFAANKLRSGFIKS
jgi:TRAP-type mannitol/chloroaromatic compound transport system substrate-binding protein